jgi:hypothetical protein
MAVARDTNGTFNSGAGTTTQNVSYTVGATANAFLFLVFQSNITGLDKVTGVTYNAVAMTQLQKVTINGNARYCYYLFIASPDGSAHNISITYSSNDSSFGRIASYNGVLQSGLDASQTRSTTTGPFNDAITTVADNCWTVLGCTSVDGNWSAGAGSNAVVGSGTFAAIFDSNAAITPAGSTTMTVTNSVYSRDTLRSQVSIAPVVASATAKNLTLLGVG